MPLLTMPASRRRASSRLRALVLIASLVCGLFAVSGCGRNTLSGDYNNPPPPKNGGPMPGAASQGAATPNAPPK